MSGSVSVAGVPKLKARFGAFIRDLGALGVFRDIGRDAARLAISHTPRRTGALAATIRASSGNNRAVVRAGSATVPYAGVVNYGWNRRGIRAAGFMQKASDAAGARAGGQVQAAVSKLVRARGLS